jgi:RimJ/RimL family protein N-acetyltransferase
MGILTRPLQTGGPAAPSPPSDATWRQGLPSFAEPGFALREVEMDDAASLLAHVATDDVSRFISPPPATVAGFERFIHWSRQHREAGHSACFAIVPEGATRAVGLFQVRSLEAGLVRAEWGFAMGSAYWGTGIFPAAAGHVLEFAFTAVGVARLEARAVVMNGRGNGALRKVGAVQEGLLRRSFLRHGEYHDQVLWSMLADEWHRKRSLHRTRVH